MIISVFFSWRVVGWLNWHPLWNCWRRLGCLMISLIGGRRTSMILRIWGLLIISMRICSHGWSISPISRDLRKSRRLHWLNFMNGLAKRSLRNDAKLRRRRRWWKLIHRTQRKLKESIKCYRLMSLRESLRHMRWCLERLIRECSLPSSNWKCIRGKISFLFQHHNH